MALKDWQIKINFMMAILSYTLERIYLEEGALALFKDNRGRSKGMENKNHKKPPLSEQIKEDLISENQRLRMENEYLKKLNALIQEQERSAKKTR